MLQRLLFSIVVLVLRLLVLLPYRVQMRSGRGLGRVAYCLAKKRRAIARYNIEACMPQLSQQEVDRYVRLSFQSAGMAVVETAMTWFMSKRRFSKIPVHIKQGGLLKNRDPNKGVLLTSAHFTSIEIAGRACGLHFDVDVVYKTQRNPVVQNFLESARSRFYQNIWPHHNMRGVIKALRNNHIVWYAPDQDFGRDLSLFVDFMGVKTATVKAIYQIPKLGKADVMQVFCHRLPNDQGYQVDFFPARQVESVEQDLAYYNQALSEYVSAHPEDYFWLHRRFKTRPEGEAPFYKDRGARSGK